MKRKNLKRMGVCFLCGMLITGIGGCGKENSLETDVSAEATEHAGKQMGENQITEEELAAYEAANDIDIEILNVKREWEEKAEIALGNFIEITGTGSEASDNNTLVITEGGAYTITGELTNGMI